MQPSTSLLKFPCEFPIKVMGLASHGFDELVMDIVRRHVTNLQDGAVRAKPSRAGKYVSLTVTLRAESQDQIDRLYIELSAHERILMVL